MKRIKFKQFLKEFGASLVGLNMDVINGKYKGLSGKVIEDNYKKRTVKIQTEKDVIDVSIDDIMFNG